MKIETQRLLKKLLYYILFLVIVVAFTIAPIALYFYHFKSNPLSNIGAEWGTFGDYISPFIGLLNFIVIGILTYQLFLIEYNRETPILYVSSMKPTLEIANNTQFIAFNIRVIFHYTDKEDEEEMMSHLMPNDSESFTVADTNYTGVTHITVESQNSHGKIFKAYPSRKLMLAQHVQWTLSAKQIDSLFSKWQRSRFVEFFKRSK